MDSVIPARRRRKGAAIFMVLGLVLAAVGVLLSATPVLAVAHDDSDCATKPALVPAGYSCAILDENTTNNNLALEGEVWWTRNSDNDLHFLIFALDSVDEVQICARSSDAYTQPQTSNLGCTGADGTGIGDRVFEGSVPNPATVGVTVDLDATVSGWSTGPILASSPVFWQLHVNVSNGDDKTLFTQGSQTPSTPPALGSITVVKDTSPSSTETFSFTLNPGSTQAVAGNGGSFTWSSLAAGSYDLTEALSAAQVAAGWSLTSVSCPGATTTAIANGVTITLASGENVTCTFSNTQTTTTTTVTTEVLGEKIEAEQAAVLGAQVLPRTGPESTKILLVAAGLAFFLGGLMLGVADRRQTVLR